MAERLKKSLLYTYGVADMFFLLMADLELFYFAVFLTDHARFSMAITGVILWVTGAIDIACAFIAGVILQKTTLKFGGKYRSWFLIGPPLFAPLFLLQFSKVGGDSLAALIIIIGFLTSHLLWNVVFAASGSMVGRLSQLPDEVTVLSANRAQGMAAAGLIFSVTGWPMIMFLGSFTGDVAGFTLAAAVFAFFMILGYWYIYKITAGKDPYDENAADTSKNEANWSVREMIGLVLRNPPLLLLSVAETFRNANYSIGMAFAIYYFKYVVQDVPFLSVFLLVTAVAGLLGSCAATLIGVRIGKRNSYWVFLVLSALGFVAAKFLGHTAWSFTLFCSSATLFAAIASSMSTGLYSDTVIYGEWKTGKSLRAFTMALSNLPIKLSILIRSATITLGLTAIGFVANASPSPGVVDGITNIMTLIPAAACMLAAVIFYFGYKIEEKHVLIMEDEIAARTMVEVR
jgi:glycoside/pentoside/hexuronide:cation symporter, GPH family